MKHNLPAILIGLALIQSPFNSAAAATDAMLRNWPQWRGPLGNGEGPMANPPIEWSEEKNVKWKVAIPGAGTATPVVWENKVFVLTAVPSDAKADEAGGGNNMVEPAKGSFQFAILCLDRQSGRELWRKVAREQVPHEGHHRDHGYASASPVTDGEHVLAYFGSRGLYCYDMEGNLKWDKDFGDMQTRMSFGEGASPALSDGIVVVNWDHEGDDDFIVALDKATGRELWRKPREEHTTWSTPHVVDHEGKKQVVVNATGKVRSYDLHTGEEIWSIGGQTANSIPSPVSANDVVYVMSGFRGNMLQAIKLGSTGDLDGTDALLWKHEKSTPYVPSPLLIDGLLYFYDNNRPALSCFDAATGKAHYESERLPGVFGMYASPVGAGEHVYLLSREGTCLVIKKGPNLEVVATNKIEEPTDASMALVGKDLFIRGHQSLYCIAAVE